MKQDPKGQVPGIDLTFADGKTGRLWGLSGVDDVGGASFEKASTYLKARAEQDDVFDWTIEIDLELVMSYSFPPLLNLISTLDRLVADDPDGGRSVSIIWRIKPGDDSMLSTAREAKEHVDLKKATRRGLDIRIVEAGPPKVARR